MPNEVETRAVAISPAPSSASVEGPKNIVICCDGTGNEFCDANSNVVKLYTALAIDNNQVGYYHPGVGTMGDPAVRHPVARWWSKVKGLAFAAGFKDNVFDAYRYLMATYNDGDRIFLFGFSRGAYTVRALAGLLDGYGLLCRGNEGHLPYAWRLYIDQHDDRNKHSIDESKDFTLSFKQTFSHKDLAIHFVGIWDTVSSVGWVSSPLRLFNVSHNRTILRGRHAVSIDERRCFYMDNLWGDALAGQDLLQVWFAGVHSDVGGSYSQATSGLSNITLEWMLNEAAKAGVLLVQDRVDLVLGRGSRTRRASEALYTRPTSSPVHRSLKGFWWILELLPHLYYDKDHGKELYRVPLGARRKLPPGAFVHHSVKKRMEEPGFGYKPKNLLDGTLLPSERVDDISGVDSDLYEYNPSAREMSSTFARLAVMSLIVLFDLAAALFLLLLAALVSVKAGRLLFPPIGHLLAHVPGWVCDAYAGLRGWVGSTLGASARRLLF